MKNINKSEIHSGANTNFTPPRNEIDENSSHLDLMVANFESYNEMLANPNIQNDMAEATADT